MRTAKLSDVQVLKKLSSKDARTSAEVARRLGLEVFQVTARLKSMEKRGLAVRKNGLWLKNYSWKQLEQDQAMLAEQAQTVLNPRVINRQRDKEIPHTTDTLFWTARLVRLSESTVIQVFGDRHGREWTRAADDEEAQLIREFPEVPGLPPVRLVRFDKNHRHFRSAKRYYEAIRRELLELQR